MVLVFLALVGAHAKGGMGGGTSAATPTCNPSDVMMLNVLYRDVYAFPPPGAKRYPDFEIPMSIGFNAAESCKKEFDLPAGCTPPCTSASCSYNSFGNGLGQKQVQPILGSDGFPVYRNNANDAGPNARHSILGNTSFWGWWHPSPFADSPSLEIQKTMTLKRECPSGFFTTSSDFFFPLDTEGLKDEQKVLGDDGKMHNFGFTDTMSTEFVYRGNEVFEFVGDDDVWVFIDGKLVIDLGGLHQSECRRLDLSNPASIVPTGGSVNSVSDPCPTQSFPGETVSLKLTVGKTYSLHFFHAERHSTGSRFKISTNMNLVPACQSDCIEKHGPNVMCNCKEECQCKPGFSFNQNGQCTACSDSACAAELGPNSQCDCSSNCACKPGWQLGADGKCSVVRTTQVCSVWPDPHFRTFDGCRYNYHGVCDYVLASTRPVIAADRAPVEVQIRTFKQPEWQWSGINEVGLAFGTDRVSVFLDGSVRVNGNKLAANAVSPGSKLGPFMGGVNGEVVQATRPIFIFSVPRASGPGVDTITVETHPEWGTMNAIGVEISAANSAKSAFWESMGLCGRYDMTIANDFTAPNSAIIADSKAFSESWQVANGFSLLSNGKQQCDLGSTCVDDIPRISNTTECANGSSYEKAKTACAALKNKSPRDYHDCLFDVCIGGPPFADQPPYQWPKCVSDCSGRGVCGDDGKCVCYPNWSGPGCDIAIVRCMSYTCKSGTIKSEAIGEPCATGTCTDELCCNVPKTIPPVPATTPVPSTPVPSTPLPPGPGCVGKCNSQGQCPFGTQPLCLCV